MPFYTYPAAELACGTLSLWTNCTQLLDTTPLSSILPADTTGLLIRVVNGGGSLYFVGLRHPDTAFALRREYNGGDHGIGVVKVKHDAGDIIFQYYKQNATQHFYLEGYCSGSDVVLFTDPIDKTPGVNAWLDVNCSSECPGAIGIIFDMNRTNGWFWGVRKKGSTDDYRARAAYHNWGMVGCDASQVIQVYNDDFGGVGISFHLLGYMTDNCTFLTNSESVKPVNPTTWEAQDLSGKSNIDIAICFAYGLAFSYGLRPTGSSESRAGGCPGIQFLHGEVSALKSLDTYVSNVAATQYLQLTGWLKAGSAVTPPGGHMAGPLVKGNFI